MSFKTGSIKVNYGVVIVLACLGVFMALAFSNYYLLKRSGEIADEVRHKQERQLVEHELNNELLMFAHAQSQISDWDDAYEALSGPLDETFILENITDWLWYDFGLLMTFVVAPDNTTTVAVLKDTRLKAGQGEGIIADNADLVEEARKKFSDEFTTRKPRAAALLRTDKLMGIEEGRFAWSIREINGHLAFTYAQAIAPEVAVEREDLHPNILFTIRAIDKDYLEHASEKLNLKDFHFAFLKEPVSTRGSLPIVTLPDGRIVHARWTPENPSQTIWDQTMPVLAAPFIVAAIILLLIALRFSHVLHALQKSEEQNRFLALHDALTGLPNRLFFDKELESAIVHKKHAHCAILCLDLDRFKAVNDNFGHEAGDEVLAVVSSRIAERLGKSGIVSRVGGDEFNILIYGRKEKDELRSLCEELIADVCSPILVTGGVAEVGASIGVSLWPEDARTVKSALRGADEALYLSKEKGRGCVSFAGQLRSKGAEGRIASTEEGLEQLKSILAKAG
ncbi:diguanylate cyclase domain-containing protein [uncultured Cohaesibacter sp.]|uniref:diguanylate cyclase domain-containing protein n=1 Tax=uncultured Cohaesibacter sp. TaxID=1002546 RepID=UPI0029C680E6|nr:diguanylate cyclase [uncultured Cohaesibacter sp.]